VVDFHEATVNEAVAFLPTAGALQVACDLVANYGVPVFPCTADKQPLTEHGFYDA
jgi:hypothetical protein